MKKKNLWIISGIPGSGKSTWLANNVQKDGIIISRDKIRFSKLEENDSYFKYEKEVFSEYCEQIKNALNSPEVVDVYADATQMTPRARLKTIMGVEPDLEKVNINCINFIVPLNICLDRNEKRKGRSYVPRAQIRRMNESFIPATPDEILSTKPISNTEYHYEWVVNIDADGMEEWRF